MLLLMQYHCSPLKEGKTSQGQISGSTSLCSLNPSRAGWGRGRVFESHWDEARLPSPDSSLSARGLPGFLLLDWHAVCLALAASALFHWMSQFLIDVFSKALLVQSLPVLVFFREITNCSAKSISELQTLGRTRPPKHLQGTWATLTAAVQYLRAIKNSNKENKTQPKKKNTHFSSLTPDLMVLMCVLWLSDVQWDAECVRAGCYHR